MNVIKKIFAFFENRSWLCWALTVIYMLVIFYISSIPYLPPELIFGIEASDLIKHALLYFGFGISLFFSLNSSKIRNSLSLSILLAILYGISDELHQLFVPNRTCSIADAVADAVGATTGIVIVAIIRNSFKHRNR